MCTWREIWILPINQQCDVIISEVGNDEYVFCGGNMSGFEVIDGGLWSPPPPPPPPHPSGGKRKTPSLRRDKLFNHTRHL